MDLNIIKRNIQIGSVTALVIILFKVFHIFLIYQYFAFDYYLTTVAVVFLLAGFFISEHKQSSKEKIEVCPNIFLNLTNKELLILKQIADGKSNKEIAAVNYVEMSTIKTHINNIYAKLGANSRREAINLFKTAL